MSLPQWIEGDTPKAIKLREKIGLKKTLPEFEYERILNKQFIHNFTLLKVYFQKNCSFAHYNLTAWNAKSGGDAFMYAVSIMSTVGRY